jgi:hypothetical protein
MQSNRKNVKKGETKNPSETKHTKTAKTNGVASTRG